MSIIAMNIKNIFIYFYGYGGGCLQIFFPDNLGVGNLNIF